MDLHADVETLLREVAARELLPRFRALAAHEIREKSPGEVVTEADLAVERDLTAGLRRILPEAVVVAEEACSREPELLATLAEHDTAFVVDPVDGTEHFARGEEPFGSMVALLRRGRAVAAWILLPRSGRMLSASRGGGAFLDGARVVLPAPPRVADARGTVLTGFLPDALRGAAEAGRAGLGRGGPHRCAAQRCFDLVEGREHFVLYYRTLPWDHAPGSLILEEAGGVVRRYDGSAYVPGDVRSGGLLIASGAELWRALHDRLVPSVPLVGVPE